ncbi:hypothetical protein Pmani_020206 [Petrolisthes manimaculis]|uniref:Uncharacterized protein n=1 Tax=Petrolisthes manimaculis TaxID=1843537 RepID=A0AAE1PJ83_9EUCA|nr:hypothetical protein Pmani_020206 [Petrolisthes manimaculis]
MPTLRNPNGGPPLPPSPVATLLVLLFISSCVPVDGSDPDLDWHVYPRWVKVGEATAVNYQVLADSQVIAVNISVKYDDQLVDYIISKVNTSGEHRVNLSLTWWSESESNQPSTQDLVRSSTLWGYYPVTPQQVSFTLTPLFIIIPPGSLSATINVTSAGELPTLLTGTLTWVDETSPMNFSLTDLTQPGSQGPVSQVYKYNYTVPGEHTVRMTLRNPVSVVEIANKVTVLEQIKLSHILVNNRNWTESEVLTTSVRVSFTPIVTAGVSTAFHLTVGEDTTTSSGHTLDYTFSSAGSYNLSIVGEGAAGMSDPVFLSVTVYRPVTLEDVEFVLSENIIWPPGTMRTLYAFLDKAMANVTVSSEELPTHLNISLSWSDDQPDTHMDLKSDTPPGATGSVTKSIERTLEQSGTYEVTLVLTNLVSQITITKQVTVLDQISLESMSVEYVSSLEEDVPGTGIYKTGRPINFTATIGSGQPTTFVLSISGTNVTSSTSTIIYTFQNAGEFKVNMTALGDAGESLPVTTTILTAVPVQDVHLNLTVPDFVVVPPGKVSIVLTIMSQVELPTHVLGFNVTWGDGKTTLGIGRELEEVTSPGTVGSVSSNANHTYSTSGDYLVEVVVFSAVSQASVSQQVRILDDLTAGAVLVNYANPDDAPQSFTPAYSTGVPLNLTAVVLSGQPSLFTFYVEGQAIESEQNSIIYTFTAAGEHLINLTTSGETGESVPVSTRVVLEQPVEAYHLSLTFTEPIVSPPGEVNVTVAVSRYAPEIELPTNLTGFLDWGDINSNTQARVSLDLTSQTTPGSLGPANHRLSYAFGQAGEYEVTLSLCNLVSCANLTQMLRVLDHPSIGGVVVGYINPRDAPPPPQMAGQVFLTGVELNLTALVEAGLVGQFVLKINGEEVAEEQGPSFTYIFERESDYEVSIQGRGAAELSSSASLWVRVRSLLSKLTLQASTPSTRILHNITYTLASSQNLGACLSLDFGDGEIVGWQRVGGQCEGKEDGREKWQASPLSTPITLTHAYSSVGVYTSVARLFSAMGELTERRNVTVLEALPCSQLLVVMERNATLDSPISITRAEKLWVRSVAKVNCTVPGINLDISWVVMNINETEVVKLPETVDTTKGTLYLPPRTLHYGLYSVTVIYNVSMTNEDGVLVWETITGESGVNVGKSDLVVVAVKGGAPRIRRGTLQTLNLNPGHFSFDPDYPEIPLVSFTWQCREEGEELPSEGEEVTSDPPTSREEYGTGQGREGGGCWGQGPGMMSNASPNFSISVNLFRTPYITYKIEVATRSKDGRTSGTGVEVEVVEGDPPTLTSACSPPWICRQVEGAQLVNPQKLILESGCVVEAGEEPVGEDGCGKVPLKYTWNVAGVAGSLIQPLDVMDVAIGLNQRKLALLDDFWVKFGSQFRTFDVQVTATRPGETSEGLALQRIRINEAPVGGTCTAEVMQDIHKDEEEEEEEEGSFEVEVRVGREEPPTLIVTALTDTVILNCTDWEDPEGFEIPKYSFFATTERGEKVTLTFSSKNHAKVILPYANLTLWAGVSDQLGAETLYMTAVVIPLLPSQELFKEYQTRKTLLKAVSARDQTRVDMLLSAEKSLMGITLPSEAEDSEDNKANDEEEEDESSATQEKNKDMLSSVDKFSITSMDEVIQVNNILGSIADPLPKESQEGAVAALKTLAGAADSTAPLAQQKDFAAGALATTASLLTGVNKNVKKGNGTSEKRAEKMVAMARRRLRRSIWNQTEEEEEEEVEEEYLPSEEDEDANKKVESLLGVVGSAQGSLLASAVVGEEPARVEAGGKVNMAVGFFDAGELDGRVVGVGGATYVFPSYCSIVGEPDDCLTNKSITVGIQMAKWSNQVHGYGGGRESLGDDSSTVQLSLVDAASHPLPVRNATRDFIIHIPRDEGSSVEPEVVEPRVSNTMPLSIHKVEVPLPNLGVSVLVSPSNQSDASQWVLAWSSSELNGSLEHTENLLYFNELNYHPDTGFYELFLDSETIGEATGTYSIGIGHYNMTEAVQEEHPCFEDPPPGTFIYSFATGFNESYSFSSFVSSCLFFNKETLSWSSEGCRVVGANTTITTCACNHLTSFGSGFFVAPNAIDFSYVFANAGFLDNLTIYLTLIISLALYFIGLVYARIKDRRDVEKVGVIPLADNEPSDQYLYVLIVHTGHIPNAGTKSKVQFLIAGDWEESDVRTLNEAETSRPLLTRGSVDHYLMATSRPLGPLHYLRIWHDNGGKGRSSSWFLGYMVVRDIQTGEQFQFICNQWLAVEEGDGLIDRLVAVAGEEQLRDLSHVFTHSVDKSMADDHLWFSVFLRPPRSRFTRVQRLSSCMALLYLSMLVNAMFYQKVPEDGAGGGLRLGPVSISPQALGIGFISNLIVFPPSFAIVFFFRKSRPRKVKESRLQIALRKQRESAGDVESEGSGNFSYSLDPKPTTLNSTVSLKELIAQQEKDKDKNKVGRRRKFSLPWWFVLVAWFLCAVSIACQGSGVSRRNKNQIGTNLTEEEIAAAKEKRLQEVAMQDLLLEILVYMIFLTLILSVSHGTKDPNVFLMRENIKNTFAHYSPPDSSCPSFLKMQDTNGLWCWLQTTLAGNLLNRTLYNGRPRTQDMCGTAIDRITFILGYPILRQIRLNPGSSAHHPVTHSSKEDNRDYGPSWNLSHPASLHYTHFSALQLHGVSIDGTLDKYSGGGYLVELRGPLAKVVHTLQTLQEDEWIDEQTHALFIEFAVYNPQVNLFGVSMFIIEFFPGGGVLPKFDFQALKLLRYHSPGAGYVLFSEIGYILFTFFYTRREYKALKKLGWSYFKSIWNIFEIWIIGLAYTTIVFYLLKTSLTYYLLDKFIATLGKKYIRIQPLAVLDNILGYVVALQVFIGTLKLLKLLRFNRRIGMLSATLKYASGDILGFGLIFIVTLVSFVTIFYLNTLSTVEEFSTFVKATESSFFLINKKFHEIRDSSPVIGPLFYFIFAFILYWVVFQLLIAIICHAFEQVNKDLSRQPNDYEVVEYMVNKLSSYLSGLRPNAVHQVNIPPPKPPNIDGQVRSADIALDRIMASLDRNFPALTKY